MSERNFGRRRRGMRFRPSGGLGQGPQKNDREATQARAEVVGETTGGGPERLFERRHQSEIERAENIAAGWPREGAPAQAQPAEEKKGQFREPDLQKPALVEEEKTFAPVQVKDQPRGLVLDLDRRKRLFLLDQGRLLEIGFAELAFLFLGGLRLGRRTLPRPTRGNIFSALDLALVAALE